MNGVKRLTEFYKSNKGRNFTVSEISEACSDFFAASAGVLFCLLPVSVFAYLQAANSWKLLTTFPVFTGVFNGFAVLSGVIAAAMYSFNSRKTSLKNVLSDILPPNNSKTSFGLALLSVADNKSPILRLIVPSKSCS